MSKNIEINYKDDSGYEILYPTTESRQVLNLLTDSTKTYIGLDPSSTPDDAFRSLYLLNVLSDKASFRLTVKTAGGTPIANLPVTCNKYLDGNSNPVAGPLYTDENGVIDTFFANGNVTLSVTGYADLENWSQQYSVVNGEQYEEEAALTTRNFLKWTSSTTTKFSSNVSRVDVSCCGGGGGGGGSSVSFNYGGLYVTGGGGAGGYAKVQEDVTFNMNQSYSVIVGTGGSAGQESVRGEATNGGNGGQSSLLDIIAQGGAGGGAGIIEDNDEMPGSGGQGNGNGGNGGAMPFVGQNGGNGTGFIYDGFTTTKLVGGGGGSGASYSSSAYNPSIYIGGKGGSPGGGNGQGRGQNVSAGSDEIGGGGGSGLAYEPNTVGDILPTVYPSAKGGSGCVAIRMHLKAT